VNAQSDWLQMSALKVASTLRFPEISVTICCCYLIDRSVGYAETIRRLTLGCHQAYTRVHWRALNSFLSLNHFNVRYYYHFLLLFSYLHYLQILL